MTAIPKIYKPAKWLKSLLNAPLHFYFFGNLLYHNNLTLHTSLLVVHVPLVYLFIIYIQICNITTNFSLNSGKKSHKYLILFCISNAKFTLSHIPPFFLSHFLSLILSLSLSLYLSLSLSLIYLYVVGNAAQKLWNFWV